MTMPKFEPVAYVDEDDDNKWATLVDDLDIKLNAPLYTAAQLTEAYEAGKRDQAAELEAARAEIERKMSAGQFVLEQLAAEQVKNVGLRELVKHFALIDLGRNLLPGDFGLWVLRARKAIATPSDTSSLEAIVKKAGEVMRENCITAAGPEDSYQDDWIRAKIDACDAIRAIPAVTMEDLK